MSLTKLADFVRKSRLAAGQTALGLAQKWRWGLRFLLSFFANGAGQNNVRNGCSNRCSSVSFGKELARICLARERIEHPPNIHQAEVLRLRSAPAFLSKKPAPIIYIRPAI